MATEFSALTKRADYYRQLALDVRTRAASMRTPVASKALAAVADDYELLARCAESLHSTWQTLERQSAEQHQQDESVAPSAGGAVPIVIPAISSEALPID